MEPTQLEDTGDVTRLLAAWRAGDSAAPDALLNLVYRQLRNIAAGRLSRLSVPVLDPTELVNEAMLRLLGNGSLDAQNRQHFFSIAATAIRYVLVDTIRRQHADKRGNGAVDVTLSGAETLSAAGDRWLDVEEALRALEQQDARKCRIVELTFLVGLNQQETAETLGVSLTTVERDLRFAKAWLREHLS
ncbi:RNA polymerase sigma factor (TIGR02999 family) [Lysobacter enzymogenes]|jgi:RNA polymerase sigma factor (TIGR02999 family)